jgi:D-alanyl-lipoteichoic acid acyltransferase DltB (MBOAT superfamily)
MPQFDRDAGLGIDFIAISQGLTFLTIGLFKKSVIADTLALSVSRVPLDADHIASFTFIDTWIAALCFSFQIYFDFSGYSDMAIGLALLFGIKLPLNFNSPYKATDMIEFWKRWHMSLTRFLTAYVYNPLVFRWTRARIAAGKTVYNPKKPALAAFVVLLAIPTIVTMELAGLWHGAGLQYLAFGLLNGSYLIVAHGWRLRQTGPQLANGARIVPTIAGVVITFLCWTVSLVFLRAQSLEAAFASVKAMAGGSNIVIPTRILESLGSIGVWLNAHGVRPGTLAAFGGQGFEQMDTMVIAALIVWALPNSQQIMGFQGAALSGRWPLQLAWRPNLLWLLVTSALVGVSLTYLGTPS